MNLNKGCIEMIIYDFEVVGRPAMNLNKGCIEIIIVSATKLNTSSMNLNKGCIEISATVSINKHEHR